MICIDTIDVLKIWRGLNEGGDDDNRSERCETHHLGHWWVLLLLLSSFLFYWHSFTFRFEMLKHLELRYHHRHHFGHHPISFQRWVQGGLYVIILSSTRPPPLPCLKREMEGLSISASITSTSSEGGGIRADFYIPTTSTTMKYILLFYLKFIVNCLSELHCCLNLSLNLCFGTA